MLRMAYYFLKPHQSPLVLEATELIYHGTWPMILKVIQSLRYIGHTIMFCLQVIKEFFLFFPLCACWITLSFTSTLYYTNVSLLYWMRRFFIDVFCRQRECDRTLLQIFLDPSYKCPATFTQLQDRRLRFDANTAHDNIGASWNDSVVLLNHRV